MAPRTQILEAQPKSCAVEENPESRSRMVQAVAIVVVGVILGRYHWQQLKAGQSEGWYDGTGRC